MSVLLAPTLSRDREQRGPARRITSERTLRRWEGERNNNGEGKIICCTGSFGVPRGRGRKKGEGREGGKKATRRVGSERGRKTRRERLGKQAGSLLSCLVAKLDSFGKRSVKAAGRMGAILVYLPPSRQLSWDSVASRSSLTTLSFHLLSAWART